MPLYEYECEACGQRFEVIQKSFSDAAVEVCRKCGKGPVRRLMSSPAIQFKGSGFYITDYAKKGAVDAGGSEKTAKSDSGASGDTGKTDSAKSDAGKSDAGKGSSATSDSGKTETKSDAGTKSDSGSSGSQSSTPSSSATTKPSSTKE